MMANNLDSYVLDCTAHVSDNYVVHVHKVIKNFDLALDLFGAFCNKYGMCVTEASVTHLYTGECYIHV